MESSKLNITDVDFIMFPTNDFERANKFYGETLGLPQTAFVERGFAEYTAGKVTLAIGIADFFPGGFQRNPNPVALRVDDVAEARAELESRGVEFHMDTLDTGVCHMVGFSDPDGNSLMLHHRYAPKTK